MEYTCKRKFGKIPNNVKTKAFLLITFFAKIKLIQLIINLYVLLFESKFMYQRISKIQKMDILIWTPDTSGIHIMLPMP